MRFCASAASHGCSTTWATQAPKLEQVEAIEAPGVTDIRHARVQTARA